jgi:hypothetical protein
MREALRTYSMEGLFGHIKAPFVQSSRLILKVFIKFHFKVL